MKTILVVEDNDVIREDVAEMLGLANYQVMTAINGKEGLEKIFANIPDLVLSDIAMPVVDGMGMLHVLRKDPKTVDLPFIFLTSKSDRHDFRSAMDLGADDYITKPFSGDELLNAVENRFKKIDSLKKKLSLENNGYTELLEAVDKNYKQSMESLTKDHDTHIFQKKQIIYKEIESDKER